MVSEVMHWHFLLPTCFARLGADDAIGAPGEIETGEVQLLYPGFTTVIELLNLRNFWLPAIQSGILGNSPPR
jgi:hypothetical protein